MSDDTASASGLKLKLTRTQWLICFIATLGFLFDIYELLMLPLIGKDALMDLAGVRPGTPEFTHWFRIIFFVPAICGGIFGLLGGYLTDLFGRRRVLTYSILLYAVAAFCAGFSTTPSMPSFPLLRCILSSLTRSHLFSYTTFESSVLISAMPHSSLTVFFVSKKTCTFFRLFKC